TGFGRTGKMFASEHVDVEPDLMCISKGITSGCLPLSATLTTEDIYNAFYADYEDKKTFYHGHTYTANPISCSAALASLKIFEENNVLKNVNLLIPEFHKMLREFKKIEIVGDVRCIGMIGALELVKDRETKEKFSFKDRIGLKIYKEGLKQNLILRPLGDIVYFFLPLSIKQKEVELIISRTFKIIKNLKG
ncbi:MAG: aspartate aminotransferase family protein, partial [Candidatus Omnitrophica bacterium]|nr:aspartate aminotransferase family protein [Candidatus Omnitrophota bacterium]